MIKLYFLRTGRYKATNTFLAHLLLDEAVRINVKVIYHQPRMYAQNEGVYVRPRRRVICSAVPLFQNYPFSNYLFEPLSSYAAANPAVFGQGCNSSFAFGHCPSYTPLACCPFPHGQSWRGFLSHFRRLLHVV